MIPGRVIKLPQVATDDLGKITPPDRPKRRPGSGQQDREGIGTNLGSFAGASHPMPSAQTLTNQQDLRVERYARDETQKGRSMTTAAEIAARYGATAPEGLSIQRIPTGHMATAQVYRWNGVQIETVGVKNDWKAQVNRKRKAPPLAPHIVSRRQRVVEMHAQGRTVNQMVSELGMSIGAIQHDHAVLGLKMNAPDRLGPEERARRIRVITEMQDRPVVEIAAALGITPSATRKYARAVGLKIGRDRL